MKNVLSLGSVLAENKKRKMTSFVFHLTNSEEDLARIYQSHQHDITEDLAIEAKKMFGFPLGMYFRGNLLSWTRELNSKHLMMFLTEDDREPIHKSLVIGCLDDRYSEIPDCQDAMAFIFGKDWRMTSPPDKIYYPD